MKNKIRNVLYWIRSIFRNYVNIDVNISDEDFMNLCKLANEADMTLSQYVEMILLEYIQEQKRLDKIFNKSDKEVKERKEKYGDQNV